MIDSSLAVNVIYPVVGKEGLRVGPLSSWLAEQEVWSSIPGLAATISQTGYLLLPSCDMAERMLKRRKSSKQLTNQPFFKLMHLEI